MGIFKKIFIAVVAVISWSAVPAQDGFHPENGSPFDPGAGTISSLMDSDGQMYYYLLTDDDGYIEFNSGQPAAILTFNHNLDYSGKIELNGNSAEKITHLKPIAFFRTSDGFILLCSRYSPIERVVKSWLFRVEENGTVGQFLHPGEIEDMSLKDAEFDFFGLYEMNRIPGQDSLKDYIFTVTTPSFLDIPERINFITYNENLEVKNNHLLDYPDDYIEYRIREKICTPQGLFFIRVEIYNPFRDGELTHQMVIYDIRSDDFSTLELNIEDAVVKKSSIKMLRDDVIGLDGYFVSGPHRDEPEGIFYYLFSASTGELLRQNIHRFSDEEKSLLNPKNLDSNSDYQYLGPSGIYLTQHNHILLLFEYNWRSLMLIRDKQGMLYDEPFYYANEIFMFRFDVTNELISIAVIPKKQTSGYKQSILGFAGFLSGNDFYMLYNDHPKNKNEYRSAELKSMKRKYVMMLGKYDLTDGQFTKSVFGDDRHDYHFNPDDVIRINPHRLLIMNKTAKPELIRIDL